MLMAASELLARNPAPAAAEVEDALGGVLCRCTGYRKIVEAVLDVAGTAQPVAAPAGAAVGARIAKVDGIPKLTGAESYGADAIPANALWLRVVRSPHPFARFTIADFGPFLADHPGLVRVLTAADVPFNGFGIYPHIKDQPVLADGVVRYQGQAVLALVGERAAVEAFADSAVPIAYEPLDPVRGLDAAMAADPPRLFDDKPDNLLIDGGVIKGDAGQALTAAAHMAEGKFETTFVEHAYIEPEAGWAVRVGERVEIHTTTQAPHMHRDEVANIMALPADRVRIAATVCGGGFGSKLDLSVQPVVALAAWLVDRPVACVYHRPESMASSTKRHPSRITARFGCDADGRLTAVEALADFDTGAYASWGPTVAGRVPVHASGPYRVPHLAARGRAWHTNAPPCGAFRGFGVPQAAIAHETLMDDLAAKLGMDQLEFRLLNAIRTGDATATGQTLEASVGLVQCLEALRPRWRALRDEAAGHNAANGTRRRGVGIGCMWYGIGNTGLSNPSTMRVGLDAAGGVTLFSGAMDIGQGSNTILAQICADSLGVAIADIRLVTADTDLTSDAGKTSASRQTFVSGRAVALAAADLRARLLRQANVGEGGAIEFAGRHVRVTEGEVRREVDLATLVPGQDGMVLTGEGNFDPPATPLDEKGQGRPYACYGFAAQLALVEVDTALGTTRVLRIVAAHDVGRAINPVQVEGQIHGGIAQGLGFALMEEYVPGRTENLHDYLIPTFGDVPEIETIIVEEPDPLGPFGAKGVGEPGLVPTAPAILGAIRHATGVRITSVPVLPHRLRAAILAKYPQSLLSG